MEEKIIIAGFGGQGVLSLGQLLAYAAINDGKEVTWLPSYGPEMRGGTSNCSIVISDKIVASPIVAHPDCLIAMNRPSLDKFLCSVKPGGLVIINKSLIKLKVSREDVKVVYIDANEIAESTGSLKNANMVVLGAYIALRKLFSIEMIEYTIKDKFSLKPQLIDQILIAFHLGHDKAQQ
jgi:2-oxoglutarate ferredoxin oxidoreductase subunit gamma